MRGVVALPAEAFAAPSSAFLPPEPLEQPARVRAAAAATATTGANLRERGWEERSIFPGTSLCYCGGKEGITKGSVVPEPYGVRIMMPQTDCRDATGYKSLPRPLSILC
ncbi:hypothetical protein GCM10010234_69910 [Streptomyces hawaiiensis]